MMLYTIKAKYFQYIHATDILPAIILSVLGVYIVVCVSVGGRGDKNKWIILFNFLHKDFYLSGWTVFKFFLSFF